MYRWRKCWCGTKQLQGIDLALASEPCLLGTNAPFRSAHIAFADLFGLSEALQKGWLCLPLVMRIADAVGAAAILLKKERLVLVE